MSVNVRYEPGGIWQPIIYELRVNDICEYIVNSEDEPGWML